MDAHPPLPPEIWGHTPPVAQEMILAQAAMLAQLRAEVAHLKATVEELAQRLGRNSATPPSHPRRSAPDAAPVVLRPSGRRAGGQPGHEGQARALLPVEAVDVVIPVKPVQCLHCQHPLPGADPQPQRHQVTEIPRVKPVVTESQLHRLVCPMCGEATRAEWPAGVPSGGFGPRVQAITALCTGAYHLSNGPPRRSCGIFFGVAMGLGTVANLEQATVQALVEPVAEYGPLSMRSRRPIWTRLDGAKAGGGPGCGRRSPPASPSLSCGCRGRRSWPRNAWERFWGWLVTDRWRAYTWYPVWRRQVCWAHLLRESKP